MASAAMRSRCRTTTTSLAYRGIIAAYCHPDWRRGKTMMATSIDSLRAAVPAGLEESAHLGRTLPRRRADVLS